MDEVQLQDVIMDIATGAIRSTDITVDLYRWSDFPSFTKLQQQATTTLLDSYTERTVSTQNIIRLPWTDAKVRRTGQLCRNNLTHKHDWLNVVFIRFTWVYFRYYDCIPSFLFKLYSITLYWIRQYFNANCLLRSRRTLCYLFGI